jgi:NAD-dependent SIR2 family protein deacetylase
VGPAKGRAHFCHSGDRWNVYVGNVDHQVGELSDTRCPECHETLVERRGYETIARAADPARCPRCAYAVPGVWAPPQPR